MNSIIVSETCTAPTAPIQVPQTQLSSLSQTCLSCPNSVHPLPPAPRPHSPPTPRPHFPLALSFTDTSIFQSLAGPPARNPCTLLLYSPGSPSVGFCSLFPGLQRGGERCPSQPLCGEDILEMVWSARHGAIWSGGG